MVRLELRRGAGLAAFLARDATDRPARAETHRVRPVAISGTSTTAAQKAVRRPAKMTGAVMITAFAVSALAAPRTGARFSMRICRRECARKIAADCSPPHDHAYRHCKRGLIRSCRRLGPAAACAPSVTTNTTTTTTTNTTLPGESAPGRIKTVFVILMENHDWASIAGNPSAPYINNVLLPNAAHAEQYYNPPRLHPSEPNYLWLEAGTNFGILDNNPPAQNHQSTGSHLVTLLNTAGVSWKAYQEGISGAVCPLTDVGGYVVHHDPFVYFDDVTDANNPAASYCVAHVRPYAEWETDLNAGTVARYNFITPNECD